MRRYAPRTRTPKVPLSVRLDPALIRSLQRMAKADGTTVSAVVARILDRRTED